MTMMYSRTNDVESLPRFGLDPLPVDISIVAEQVRIPQLKLFIHSGISFTLT